MKKFVFAWVTLGALIAASVGYAFHQGIQSFTFPLDTTVTASDGSKARITGQITVQVTPHTTTVAPQPPPPSPPPTSPPPPQDRFVNLPAGSALPSGSECASRVRRNAWEPRPQNRTYNQTRGNPIQIAVSGYEPEEKVHRLLRRVDGNFVGTTDEVIQWASCKWGFGEDVNRAVAVIESWWNQDAAGDSGESIGLYQVRCMWGRWHKEACPDAQRSTAFNADYALGWRRACFEGLFSYWGVLPGYGSGDLKGCIGLWFSGRWYDEPARGYIARFEDELQRKRWETDSTFYNGYTNAGPRPNF